MSEYGARQKRVEKLILDMEATIAEARETTARVTRFFREMGIEDEARFRELFRRDRLSPALRIMVDEDLASLNRELQEEEAALMVDNGHRQTRKPRQRRRQMIRI